MSARVDVRLDTRAGGTIAHLTLDNRAKLNTLDRALMRDFIGKVDGAWHALGLARAGAHRRR